jgi:hypothetical protein
MSRSGGRIQGGCREIETELRKAMPRFDMECGDGVKSREEERVSSKKLIKRRPDWTGRLELPDDYGGGRWQHEGIRQGESLRENLGDKQVVHVHLRAYSGVILYKVQVEIVKRRHES